MANRNIQRQISSLVNRGQALLNEEELLIKAGKRSFEKMIEILKQLNKKIRDAQFTDSRLPIQAITNLMHAVQESEFAGIKEFEVVRNLALEIANKNPEADNTELLRRYVYLVKDRDQALCAFPQKYQEDLDRLAHSAKYAARFEHFEQSLNGRVVEEKRLPSSYVRTYALLNKKIPEMSKAYPKIATTLETVARTTPIGEPFIFANEVPWRGPRYWFSKLFQTSYSKEVDGCRELAKRTVEHGLDQLSRAVKVKNSVGTTSNGAMTAALSMPRSPSLPILAPHSVAEDAAELRPSSLPPNFGSSIKGSVKIGSDSPSELTGRRVRFSETAFVKVFDKAGASSQVGECEASEVQTQSPTNT